MTSELFAKKLGIRLKALRKRKELNQSELAKKCGLSLTFLSLLETGDRLPSLDSLKTICDTLKISLSEFFDDRELGVEKHDVLSHIRTMLAGKSLSEIQQVASVIEAMLKKS